MKTSPPSHRKGPWDAAGRSDGRLRGDTHPRAGGRKPDAFPSRLPAARVVTRAPCPGYRVLSEDAYLAGVDLNFGPLAPVAGAGRRGRTLHRLAGAAALSGAIGAGIGAVALAARRPARTDRHDTASGLLAQRSPRDESGLARGSVGAVPAALPRSSSPSARSRPLLSATSVRQPARARTSERTDLTPRLGTVGARRPATAPRMASPADGPTRAAESAEWTRAVPAAIEQTGSGVAAGSAGTGTDRASAGDGQMAGAGPALRQTARIGPGEQQTDGVPSAASAPANAAPATADAQSQFGFEH